MAIDARTRGAFLRGRGATYENYNRSENGSHDARFFSDYTVGEWSEWADWPNANGDCLGRRPGRANQGVPHHARTVLLYPSPVEGPDAC